MVFQTELKCPACMRRLRYATSKEAFNAYGCLGIIDLLPSLRELPDSIRLFLRLVLRWLMIAVLAAIIVRLRRVPNLSDATRVFIHLAMLSGIGLLVILPVGRFVRRWIGKFDE